MDLFQKGFDVITVLHSYGGIVGGAAMEGLYKHERLSKGEIGGIIGLILGSGPITVKKGISATENLLYLDVGTWFGGEGVGALDMVKSFHPLTTIFPLCSKTDSDPQADMRAFN